jgi:hypothetical protein
MGRSVNYLSGATHVSYMDTSEYGMRSKASCEVCDEYYMEEEANECCGKTLSYRIEYDEFSGRYDFDYLIEDFQSKMMDRFKSLEICEEHDGRETSIVLENSLVELGISEYCGLTSFSVRPKDSLYEYTPDLTGLAKRNAEHIGKWMSENIGDIQKIGSFSNGEGVYERKTK